MKNVPVFILILYPALLLAQPPIVTQPPATVGTCKGDKAKISVVMPFDPNLSFQWAFVGSDDVYPPVVNNSAFSGVQTATLTINTKGLTVGYKATFRCFISHPDGNQQTNDVYFTVLPIPSQSPTTTSASGCGPQSFTLSASGATGGLTYEWYTAISGGSSFHSGSTYTTPVLSTTTNYYVALENSYGCGSSRRLVTAEVLPLPDAPTTTSATSCGSAILTLTASGGANGQYHWYSQATGGSPIAGESSGTYTTPTLNSSTTYYVSIDNGNCEGDRSPVTAQINTIPGAPTTAGDKVCGSASLTLTASGGADGQYRWYTQATGGSAITGETSATYATPTLNNSTTYYAAIHDGTCESTRTAVVAEINAIPTAPTATGDTSCGSASLILIASGGSGGEYRWYDQPTGGSPIAGETTATYTTPTLTSTTSYFVAINDGVCESTRTAVEAEINTVPAAPTATSDSACGSASLTLTAAGGTDGQYRWYTQATGGSPITGETSATYTTPTLNGSATYYVTIDNGNCESERSAVEAIVNDIPDQPTISSGFTTICEGNSTELYGPDGFSAYLWSTGATTQSITVNVAGNYTLAVTNDAGCTSSPSEVLAITTEDCNNNLPPVIDTEAVTTEIGSTVSINLLDLISDPDNNLDLSTLQIVEQPQSGAIAVIDANHNLVIDYTGISFSGIDELVISVCDVTGSCAQQTFNIDVVGDIVVYNAISPNGDGKNDYLYLQYIDVFDETKENRVSIYNRWGSVVFETTNYNNETNVFSGLNNHGKALPSGTYYYKIEFASGKKDMTGFISLRNKN